VSARQVAWTIAELAPDHDRGGFDCGHPSLDAFIKQFASQNQKSGVSRTFVALRPGEATVCGYYSLSAGSVQFGHLTDEQRRRLPRYPVPVAHLGRLAVDRSAQGQGLGSFMLVDALRRVDKVDRDLGIHAVEVVAIDAAARRFYLKYGFTELADDPHHLFISMKTVRRVRLA